MISISKLARRFGLSRTTLLYFDRIGLLHPTGRSEAGYRIYGEGEIECLQMIYSYRNVGLKLREIKLLLARPHAPDEDILPARFAQLNQEVIQLRTQQRAILGFMRSLGSSETIRSIDKEVWIATLRSCGLDDDDMSRWHDQFEHDAPDAHHSLLFVAGNRGRRGRGNSSVGKAGMVQIRPSRPAPDPAARGACGAAGHRG